jgi:DNA-binding transcriptional MerR regulator
MSNVGEQSLFPWEEESGEPSQAEFSQPRPEPPRPEPPRPEQPQPEQPQPEQPASAGRPDARSDAAADPRPEARPEARMDARPEPTRPLVRKEYYSISEVAELVGLPAHVLRYWESQFSVLNPSKNRSGNRVYQRKEIKLILLVKQLLHEEKYTVEGAKQKLDQLRRGGGLGAATRQALDGQLVRLLREDLQALGELLRVDGE